MLSRQSSRIFSYESITLLAQLAVAVSLLYLGYYLFLSPLSCIRGPFAARFSRLWLAYHGFRGDLHKRLLTLHETHGNLVRIGPDEVSTTNLQAVQKIYGAGSSFPKSDWYKPGKRNFDLFAERNTRIHAHHRRLVSSIYAMSSLKDLEPYMDTTISCFMAKIGAHAGQKVDFGVWLQLFAFDVIGEVSFSRSFGLMERGEEDMTLKQIKAALQAQSWIGQIPWIHSYYQALKLAFGSRLGNTARNGSIVAFAAAEVQARQARGGHGNDLLGKLFQAQKAKPDELKESDIVSMATSNIFAGSDTTALSLRAMFYYLLKNPDCMKRLVDEIDNKTSKSDRSIVSYDDAIKMPYLQAVMNECMRLHGSVGQTLPRIVPPEGLRIGNTFIPGGVWSIQADVIAGIGLTCRKTTIGTSPYVLGRCREAFGDDATKFRPDRWLQEDKGDIRMLFFSSADGLLNCEEAC